MIAKFFSSCLGFLMFLLLSFDYINIWLAFRFLGVLSPILFLKQSMLFYFRRLALYPLALSLPLSFTQVANQSMNRFPWLSSLSLCSTFQNFPPVWLQRKNASEFLLTNKVWFSVSLRNTSLFPNTIVGFTLAQAETLLVNLGILSL